MQPSLAKFFQETNPLRKYTGSFLSPYHHPAVTMTSYTVTLTYPCPYSPYMYIQEDPSTSGY